MAENELATTGQSDKMSMPLTDAPITMKTLQTLMATPTVPSRYKNSETGVQDMYAAVLHGQEMGLGPMEAIDKLILIDGSKSMYGTTMCAQIWRHGHAIKIVIEDKGVTAIAFRRDPYTHELVEMGEWTFTQEDAKAAYLEKKDTYDEYPKLMYTWRAVSALARIYFPDCVAGFGYVPEEVGLDDFPVEPIPEFVPIVIDEDGSKMEVEQASAVVEEVLGAEVVMDK
ncbi:MAG: hypothetical protein ABFR89_02390 [Actinomycetota bacterium]